MPSASHRGKSIEIVDQDELQLLDELNKEWVEAWKKAVFKNIRVRKTNIRVRKNVRFVKMLAENRISI